MVLRNAALPFICWLEGRAWALGRVRLPAVQHVRLFVCSQRGSPWDLRPSHSTPSRILHASAGRTHHTSRASKVWSFAALISFLHTLLM